MLIEPCGGTLIDLREPADTRAELKALAETLPSIQLSERATCDLELLAVGGFSPLDRFMTAADLERVIEEMRLASGQLFPVPVTLPVSPSDARGIGGQVTLRSQANELLAVLSVDEVFEWDRRRLAERVLGTTDPRHPLVAEIEHWGPLNISGRLRVYQTPRHYDFSGLRMTPSQTRAALERMNAPNVVAFQTRNPLHRAHEELTKRSMASARGALLLHPSVGMTKPGDVDHYTRVRTYQALVSRYYEPGSVLLSLLPLAMRLAGPREALWHALIRRNYGASHFIVGRDHASPGVGSNGRPFYEPYGAQHLVEQYALELGVTMVPFTELVYLPDEDRYEEAGAIKPGTLTLSISGTQLRDDYLNRGKRPPRWFWRPEVADILCEAYPPSCRQGCAVWFTGLSGAGKSTTAEVLVALLLERGRQTTLLDGDVVRTHLSRGLGFSREDRDTNILRIGFVAAEVARHGGIAICAAISPYSVTRSAVREMIGQDRFVEVFVDTPIEVCEQRDSKGLYAKARRGELNGFTGVDDPYESPPNPEVVLDGAKGTPTDNARRVLEFLALRGLVLNDAEASSQNRRYAQPATEK
jgi:sulfate adenylyltransferase